MNLNNKKCLARKCNGLLYKTKVKGKEVYKCYKCKSYFLDSWVKSKTEKRYPKRRK